LRNYSKTRRKHVGKVLDVNPADLPVERPTKWAISRVQYSRLVAAVEQ